MDVYILKCVSSEHKSLHESANGFQYPELGYVEAPDFSSKAECGGGLHGFLWGKGNGSLASYSGSEIWKVIKVPDDENLIHIDREKVKFKGGTIVCSGTRKEATDFLRSLLPPEMVDKTIIGEFLQVGDTEKASGGDYSTVSGGDRSTVSGGHNSTVSGGHNSELRIRYYDGDRYRTTLAYVGENGIEPNQKYKLNKQFQFEKILKLK